MTSIRIYLKAVLLSILLFPVTALGEEIIPNDLYIGGSLFISGATYDGTGASVDDEWGFTLQEEAALQVSLVDIVAPGLTVFGFDNDFSASLQNQSGQPSGTFFTTTVLDVGHYVLKVVGTAIGTVGASYAGTISALGNAPDISPVPIPAAAWLFGSALLGLAGIARRRNQRASYA